MAKKRDPLYVSPEFYDLLVEKGLLDYAEQLAAQDPQTTTIARINAYWNGGVKR